MQYVIVQLHAFSDGAHDAVNFSPKIWFSLMGMLVIDLIFRFERCCILLEQIEWT